MVEALMDKKTWLFALFAATSNVPNSITNQLQIIISSFGFTTLDTTLLGCVNGVVQIITIYPGVTIVSHFPNSRAWVAILAYIPNILSVFLVNFLPWRDKVGLLFSVWLSGKHELLLVSALKELLWSAIATTGYAIAIAWVSQTTAGHTKRVTTNAIMLSGACVGNAAGPFMWQAKYKPR